jgi:hypothetical protein
MGHLALSTVEVDLMIKTLRLAGAATAVLLLSTACEVDQFSAPPSTTSPWAVTVEPSNPIGETGAERQVAPLGSDRAEAASDGRSFGGLGSGEPQIGGRNFSLIKPVPNDTGDSINPPASPPAAPPTTTPTTVAPPTLPSGDLAFFEDFATAASLDRFEFGLYHRDDVVVSQNSWPGDHADNGDGTCAGPDSARSITRGTRSPGFNNEWNYWCPNGTGHMMTSIGDTSGYSIGSFSPWQTFEDVTEIRWDINVTDLGGRQFAEVKLIPASAYDTQNLPCIPDLPCDTDDYDVLGAVGATFFNNTQWIGTPAFPDGFRQDHYSGILCHLETDGFCFTDQVYDGDEAFASTAIRRTQFFRDNGDGTLTFGSEMGDGTFSTLTGPGAFPDGPVRVAFTDHSYTPNKDLGPLGERYTWHWDSIAVATNGAPTPISVDFEALSHESGYCVLPGKPEITA